MQHPADRFQKLIDHVNRAENLEPSKRRHICSALEYFKRQLLSDSDRRDSPESIKASWLQFDRLIQGSRVFDEYRKNISFWQELESSVGIIHKIAFIEPPPKRKLTAEEFFLDISHNVSRTLPEGPDKKLLLFGLWYLALEARLAKSYRIQPRIELAYRYLHPRLKEKGLLQEYENNTEVQEMVKYFVRGTVF